MTDDIKITTAYTKDFPDAKRLTISGSRFYNGTYIVGQIVDNSTLTVKRKFVEISDIFKGFFITLSSFVLFINFWITINYILN